MVTKIKPIILPSFLRRTMKAYALKAHIRGLNCELNRIGRSRNWKLVADKQQLLAIINVIEGSEEESWQWLAKFLRKQQEAFTFEELVFIATQNSGITVNQLMARTDCTIAQARKVIDELEFLD
ncbi:ribosome recycling factor family protein [Thalassotalea atypica]|uniref:ribosome recycling factor family protein n=1 Tax=Thalassotalea atypica TaxID=2054316 RepID=UPI0025746142|nr:ribosome recycling factor family protein [Thalassotalea atypica]